MAGHLLPLGGEGGAVALLHRLDVHAHGCGEERGLGGGGVEKREEPEVRQREISKAKPDFTGFLARRIKRPSRFLFSLFVKGDSFVIKKFGKL